MIHLCVNCQHYIADIGPAKCAKAYETSPVDGSLTFKYAAVMRMNCCDCGEDGVLFEPATPKAARIISWWRK